MLYRRIRDALIYLLIACCFVAIIVSQILLTMSKESKTEDTVMFTTRHSISFTGVIVRNEKLVHSQYYGDGIINYCVSDGARLSKKSQIARIYDSYDQIYYRYKIERLSDMLEVLEKAQDKGTTEYAQPEFISSQISTGYKDLLSDIKKRDLIGVYDDKLDLLKLMCIYNVATNVEDDYSIRTKSLQAELVRYNTALVAPASVVNSTESGYFTSVVDGYESDINIDSIGELTADDIRSIIASPKKNDIVESNVIGKVFNDYRWKMVGIIDTPDRYFVNQTLELILTSLDKSYTAAVESITLTGNGNEAIIVIVCDEMDASIAAARVLDAELLFGEYTGIRAPRSAIRFKDNEKGVYVLEGEKMIFKKLRVVYEGDDYVLSEYTESSDYLSLYDRVLLDPVPTVTPTDNSADDGSQKQSDDD